MLLKKISILLTLCLTAAGVAYLAASRRDEIPEMTLRMLTGTASLTRDGETTTVDGEESLEPGDVIETAGSAAAELRLRGARNAWLQEGTEVVVVDEATLGGMTGALRARAMDTDMVVEFDGIEAHASDAHFRIDQSIGSARAAAYSGEVRLSKPGEPRLTIDRLFEAEVPAADLPTEARPYRLDEKDEWDQRILDDVITLNDDLMRRGQGLTSQLGGQRPRLAYFSALADRDVPFMRRYLKRSPSELLIGFTVARNSEVRSLKRSFRNTMGYRDDGGAWGVVASIMEAERKVLLADLDSVLVATGAGGGGGAAEPQFTLATAAGAEGTGDGDGSVLGSTKEPSDDDKGGKGDDKGDGAKDCTDPADCIVKDVEDQLPNPDPSPTDPPDDDDGGKDGPLTGGIINPVKP